MEQYNSSLGLAATSYRYEANQVLHFNTGLESVSEFDQLSSLCSCGENRSLSHEPEKVFVGQSLGDI